MGMCMYTYTYMYMYMYMYTHTISLTSTFTHTFSITLTHSHEYEEACGSEKIPIAGVYVRVKRREEEIFGTLWTLDQTCAAA